MNYKDIIQILAGHPLVKDATKWMKSKSQNLQINGLQASGKGMMLSAIQQKSKAKMLVVMEDAETAAYLYNDINRAMPTGECGLIPSSYKKSPKHGAIDLASEIMRADALNIMSKTQNSRCENKNSQSDNEWLIITSPEGLIERVAPQQTLHSHRITIKKSEEIDHEQLIQTLNEWQFELVEFVYEPGQYALRGSIIDIFSFANERPYRIDFWGDTVESIRIFDIEKQLSINEIDSIDILPNISVKNNKESISIFNFIPEDTIICWANLTFTIERLNEIYNETLVKQHSEKNIADLLNLLLNGNIAKEQIANFKQIILKNSSLNNSSDIHKTEVDINNFRLVDYCYYNCCEPDDYFDEQSDPFYDEV